MNKGISLALLGMILLTQCGCVPTMIMGAATTTAATMAEERGIGGTFSDSSIRARINMNWAANRSELLPLVEVTVREGRVLLSGTVDNPEQQIDAIRLVWEVSGVKEVIDKMEIGEGTGVFGYMSDSWVTTKLRTKLLTDSDIHSINYTIKTVKGVVYIMGIALSAKELEKVLSLARNISGVERVVSYVRIKEKTTTGNSASFADEGSFPYASENRENVQVESFDQPNTSSSFD